MSWQAYVDSNLLGSGKVSKAAILGLKGGVWATSAGFTIAPAEQTAILAALTNPEAAQASGVRIDGEKYFTLQADTKRLYGKKAANGVVIVKTIQAVLVGVYMAPIQAAEATPVVEALADYLVSVSY